MTAAALPVVRSTSDLRLEHYTPPKATTATGARRAARKLIGRHGRHLVDRCGFQLIVERTTVDELISSTGQAETVWLVNVTK